ncbi:MAG: ATP-binding cassette domain-containing protein [Rhodobacteraceae bacterium]|nr:ATP-binding cassette domain-containing protein [Paracoccaceae bacterium]
MFHGHYLGAAHRLVTAKENGDCELVPAGVLTVIGANDSGKSTLINTLSGALCPDHGEVKLEGCGFLRIQRGIPRRLTV